MKLETKEKVGTKGKAVTREMKVRGELKEARDVNENSYVTMASLLHETYHGQFYVPWGHESFEAYCENELEFGYRKAKHLIEIWDKVSDLKLDHAQVAALGWTKMRDLVHILTAKNADKWLKKAEGMSQREIQDAVKITRQKDGDPGVRATKTTLSMTMSEAEAQIVLEAIETAKGLAETDNVVLAMEMICQEWLEYKGAVPEARSLDAQVAYLEKVYGIKLTVEFGKTKETSLMDDVEDAVAADSKAKAPAKAKAKAKAKVVEDDGDDDDDDDALDDFDDAPAPPKKGGGKGKKSKTEVDSDLDDLLGL